MSGYTRSQIIDCPRTQSLEAIAFNNTNPSIWTNQIGDGVRVKAGDKISVHSTYISEIGAQTGEIEIKGESFNQPQDVTVTSITNSFTSEPLPQKLNLVTIENKTQSIDLRDDTLNLISSPYKSANGDNYMFLPRRWAHSANKNMMREKFDRSDGKPDGGTGDTGNTYFPFQPLNICHADRSKIYEPNAQGLVGADVPTKISGRNDGSRYTIFSASRTFLSPPSSGHTTLRGFAVNGSSILHLAEGSDMSGLDVSGSLVYQAAYGEDFSGPLQPFPNLDPVLSVDTDLLTMTMTSNATVSTNSHNTFIFVLLNDYHYLPANTVDSAFTADQCEAFRDPAIWNQYYQRRDLISLKANPGYNSPQDVSDQLTEELNARTNFDVLSYKFLDSHSRTFEEEFTFKTETPSYKLYNCATATSTEKTYFEEWFKVDKTGLVSESYQYLASYQNIGVKRPEFFTKGHLLNSAVGFNTDYRRFQLVGDKVFNTALAWTPNNLLKIKDFLDQQSIYPELFEQYKQNSLNISVEDCRMVHMNLYDNDNGTGVITPAGPNASFGANIRSPKVPVGLGYDLYNSTVSASQTSFPLFIDYNVNSSGLTDEDVGYTNWGNASSSTSLQSNFLDLAYGFARKIRIPDGLGGYDYTIGFQFTRSGDKIPDHFFHANASAAAGPPPAPDVTRMELGSGFGRYWGYDYHFSSYGNATLMLYNGNNSLTGINYGGTSRKQFYLGQQPVPAYLKELDPYQFGIYLGADIPAINYDPDQQRFQFENLHSAELVGDVYDNSFVENVPNNPNGGVACYKINKRPLLTNYTPELLPYGTTFSASLAGVKPSGAADIFAVRTFVAANPNIESWKILDTRSGIFIEDWIVPEKLWDRNLAGIMGFRYEQFHNPNSTDSRQTRIRAHGANADLNNVDVITTNANVNIGDVIDYDRNIGGGELYQITNTVGRVGNFFTPFVATDGGQNLNSAVIQSPVTSVKITAKRLPTKTLRPYYTVRSDIIVENQYLGGQSSGITLPIVNITNKANPYGDFLNGIGGDIIFTNTIDRVISSIKCSIHEPDGTAAKVDLNSAVIFKIDSQLETDLNVVNTLLQSKKKSDIALAQEMDSLGGQGI